MEGFSIGEVEKLTGIKAHILRYWEEAVPLLQVQKDLNGRRVYSKRDLDFIFKLDYLINKKKYTLEGAGKELLNQAAFASKEAAAVSQLRSELLNIYKIIKEKKEL
ncbi:MerR family transcriptional regulator [Treponema pedis]|uniref:MerR family transcriptional regulator n=2 Tax=Treponema pedis TaxID=409322 RepID=S6A532_9SPIR|nr:MerR family transcriptional regulator [Treponema pedis]AGT45041.1 MerR family transcriptional regulator [Treponema pedis str. T A4]QOW60305.1 MerR family transcriptional regulator [Treponema pedis]QSI05651.1 MerR family transcriptional regulator [Treponema pedis]